MIKLKKGKYTDSQGIVWIFQNEVEKRMCFQTNEHGHHREVERLHQKMVREDRPDIFDWYRLSTEGFKWY